MGVGAERPRTRGGTSQKLGRNAVRLKVEIHEIQFSEVTNYRNPRNPPPISRNPHAKSEIQHWPRNPQEHPQKLIIEIHQHWTECV